MKIDPIKGLRWLYEHPEVAVAVDTETTGLLVYDGRDQAIGASIAYRDGDGKLQSFYVAWGHVVGTNHDEVLKDQLGYVLDQGRTLVLCNAQFDFFSLRSAGIDVVHQPFYDLPTMAHLINENAPISHSLENLCQHYLGAKIKLSEWEWEDEYPLKKEKESGWPNTTPAMMDEYARIDTEATYKLWEELLAHKFWVELPAEIWENKADVIRVLIAMRARGVEIDKELTSELLAEGEDAKANVVHELGGLNPGSHKDAYELFINRLDLPVLKRSAKTKAPSFDKTVMPEYDMILENRGDPTAKLVKAWRGWNTAVGLLLRPYLNFVSPDGRLRTSYRTDVTVTGRLSAREPNLQQISKDGGAPWNNRIKKCFRPKPGFVLLNCDFSQLELRLASGYADETKLKTVFNEDRDIFTEMTEQLKAQFRALGLHQLAEEWSRGKTKTLVYSMQYGAGRTRVKNAFGVSESVAQKIIDNYKATYRRFALLNDNVAAIAERDMRVQVWTGRYRKFQYKSQSYKAMNSLIQGGAADIVERVMVRCFKEFDDDETCRLLLTVHDSLVWEIREGLVEELKPKIVAMMADVDAVTAFRGDTFGVKFAVEADIW